MTTAATRPRVLMIATARPTFVIEVAETRASAARALLESLGAEVHGPQGLGVAVEDVDAADLKHGLGVPGRRAPRRRCA